MTLNVDATYENGVLRPKQMVSLPEGAEVHLSIIVPDGPVGDDTDCDPLAHVIGIGDGPASGDAAGRHDDYIYGQ